MDQQKTSSAAEGWRRQHERGTEGTVAFACLPHLCLFPCSAAFSLLLYSVEPVLHLLSTPSRLVAPERNVAVDLPLMDRPVDGWFSFLERLETFSIIIVVVLEMFTLHPFTLVCLDARVEVLQHHPATGCRLMSPARWVTCCASRPPTTNFNHSRVVRTPGMAVCCCC